VPVSPGRVRAPVHRPGLSLLGWGYPGYELSPKASYGPDSMRRLIADARAAGVSKLLVHARDEHATFYPSKIAANVSVGEWDVMAAAVEEGRKQDVEVYAAYILGIAQEADLKAHPGWACLDREGKPDGWYCYNNPEVRAFHGAMLAEIVTRYPVAGVSLDFCRPGGGCFCPRCAELFQARYSKPLKGIDPYDRDWVNFQRDSITQYMRELRQALRQARPDARFSGYVWGRFAPDADRAGQAWPRWLKEGIMDFVAVGQYSPSTPEFRAECQVLRQIADRDLRGDVSGICPLLGVGYIRDANPSYAAADAVIARHLQAVQEEGLTKAGVFAFFEIRPHLQTVRAFARTK